jgi:NAD(P)-dependent dehydrogenase (short-subunit alcohol dehydrogenase family)
VYKLFLDRSLSHEQIQQKVNGKVMLITGAARGFGRDFALKFASCGAKLVLVDLREELVKQTAEECRKLGAEVHHVAADLCISENSKKVVDEAIEKFSGLDHLILNHGMMPVKPVREMSPDLVERVLLGNHVSHALIAKHSLEHLIKSKGQISVMSSTSAHLALYGYSPYCSSKAGLRGFFESLRIEVEDYGVTTTMIYPGPTYTDLIKEVFSNKQPFYQRMLFFSEPEKVTPGIIDAIVKGKRTHYTELSTRITALIRFFFATPVDKLMKYIRY